MRRLVPPGMLFKTLAPITLILGFLISQTPTAAACGGLVAPNGSVRLSRAATLIAWHDGIEHYLTSFSYQGDASNLGWIVPLPAVPLKIQEGGAWTLQRLFRETHPVVADAAFGAEDRLAAAPSAQVIEQVKVEALDITVLRGSGQEVLDWAAKNGFSVAGDTRDHLLAYAQGSPIFMAAKYDTAAARARGQLAGDGAPVLITMRTAHPWVPLEVLALDGQQVHADLYFLTDEPLNTSDVGTVVGQSAVGTQVPGAPGFTLAFQERMNPTLYHDLSTDRNMRWVRPDGWLTYLSLDAPDTAVTYDMGVTSTGVIRLAHYGTPPMAVVDGVSSHAVPGWAPRLPLGTPEVALALAVALGILAALAFVYRRLARSAR